MLLVGEERRRVDWKRVSVTTNHGRHRIIQSVFSEAFVAAPSNPSCSSPACHGVFLDLRHANPSLMTLH